MLPERRFGQYPGDRAAADQPDPARDQHDRRQPFGAYLGEILRAEGFNTFQSADLADVTGTYLASFTLVVLAETPLTGPQAAMFSTYVSNGGQLIAMRPDAQLASTLGLTRAGGTTADGYMLANADHPVGAGIANQTLQFHGAADNYTLNGATSLATLYSERDDRRPAFPAATLNHFGSGWAAAFTYDLARSVAYTRQGNPATAGTDADGDGVVRTIDAFMGGWVDLNRVAGPAGRRAAAAARQPDRATSASRAPPAPPLVLPRRRPRSRLVVVTGDDHGQLDASFQNFASVVESHGGRMTFYLSALGALTRRPAAGLARGRPRVRPARLSATQDGRPSPRATPSAYNWFTTTQGGAYGQPSRDRAQPPGRVAGLGRRRQGRPGRAGIRAMSIDFYNWGAWLQKPDGSYVCSGYPTGSGLPMQFVDQTGALVPVYQQTTELVDEMMITGIPSSFCGLTQAQARRPSRRR